MGKTRNKHNQFLEEEKSLHDQFLEALKPLPIKPAWLEALNVNENRIQNNDFLRAYNLAYLAYLDNPEIKTLDVSKKLEIFYCKCWQNIFKDKDKLQQAKAGLDNSLLGLYEYLFEKKLSRQFKSQITQARTLQHKK